MKQPTVARTSASELPTDVSQTIAQVGERIRTRRKAQRLTLTQVAERTGLSVSMLSMVERGLAGASIGTLVAVSAALDMRMNDLFEYGPATADGPVTRQVDQPQIETAEGVTRTVAHIAQDDGMEMAINEYEPGTASGESPTHHTGKEFGVVLSGSLIVELDGVEHVLKSGDAITYNSSQNHRIINPGRTRARAVWVNLSD